MRRILLLLLFTFMFSSYSSGNTSAASYETMTAFVPDIDKSSLEISILDAIEEKLAHYRSRGVNAELPERRKQRIVRDSMSSLVFDINDLTAQGWEIKTSRRAWWKPMPSYPVIDTWKEWGTEYTLQRRTNQ